MWFYIVFFCFAAPFLGYFISKFVTFGILSGRKLFEERQQRKQMRLFSETEPKKE